MCISWKNKEIYDGHRIFIYVLPLRIVTFLSRCFENSTSFKGVNEILTYFLHFYPFFFFFKIHWRKCPQYLFSNYEFREYRRIEAIFYPGPEIMFVITFQIYCVDLGEIRCVSCERNADDPAA